MLRVLEDRLGGLHTQCSLILLLLLYPVLEFFVLFGQLVKEVFIQLDHLSVLICLPLHLLILVMKLVVAGLLLLDLFLKVGDYSC